MDLGCYIRDWRKAHLIVRIRIEFRGCMILVVSIEELQQLSREETGYSTDITFTGYRGWYFLSIVRVEVGLGRKKY
jgi:hypothetical protein